VQAAQQALAQNNYYRGPIDGQLNDDTRRALFQFQVDHGLSATGNLDGRTAQALGINLGTNVGVSGVGTTLSGAILSASQAAALRRDAQSIVTRERNDLSATSLGRLGTTRAYTQADIDLWFALSAFADNASIYEQIVTNGSNRDAAILAGRSLGTAAQRVDAAMQNARPSMQVQSSWNALRQQITSLNSSY
jgi:peptidoglycan hydrolase-like protein with peptidoglycan-binding domain